MEGPRTSAELVEEARAAIDAVSPEQLISVLEDDQTLLIDVRELEERNREGSIPGSVHVPRGKLEFLADPTSSTHRLELDPARSVIVHCAGGRRSALAAKTLEELGYGRVAYLEGGFNAWREAGHPVESGL
jgi:rhodanese-related sulfurtransferase